jgi:hypothetical protein
MAVRIHVAQGIVEAVLILIQRLRVRDVSVNKSLLFAITGTQNVEFVWPALKVIRSGEPALGRGIVSGEEII